METAIVILNYNGKKHLETFLPSVVTNSSNNQIIVADNASTDESISFLKECYPEIELLQNKENLGYAGGYNWALKQVQSKFYILLNSDVEVTPNWVEPLVELLKSDEKIVACQPKILSFTEKGNFEYAGAAGGHIDWLGFVFCRGRFFDKVEKDDGQYNDQTQVFWASGACLAIKAESFHSHGGFDETFFAHMEEVDLCWRLQNTGKEIFYTSKSTVFHLGGGTLHKSNARKTYLNYRNNLAMIYKNSNARSLFLLLLFRLILDGISGVRLFLKGDFKNVWAIIKAHFAFYGMLPNLRKKRAINPQKAFIYPKSIILDYFIRNKKTFGELEW